MKKDRKTESLNKRYRKLSSQLGQIGPVLQGTISERTIVREDPYAPGEEKIYGPYYQWTFKEKGKTRTVNLSAQQVKVFRKAIDNQRKMDQIIKEMRELSLKICEAKTAGVRRRKTKK